MGYKTIVCGVTGSLHSQKAALEAAIMAVKSQAELIYVYVVDVSFLKRGSGFITSGAVADSLDHLGVKRHGMTLLFQYKTLHRQIGGKCFKVIH
jgi:nucleotide-binding universal stress UspA family protein